MSETVPLHEMLDSLGYGDPAAREASKRVLVAARLTSGKKAGIDASKRGAVEEVLRGSLALLCARCAAAGAGAAGRGAREDGRPIVPASDAAHCEACGGSANQGAVRRAADAMRAAGAKRLLVVGGGPGVHAELLRLWPGDLKLQIVDGDSNDHAKSARSRLDWADVVVVWGGTILSHRVSKLYTDPGTKGREKIVTVMRRGIEALAEEVVKRCRPSAR